MQDQHEAALNALRRDLAERGQWNIGFFYAGFLYWLAVLAIGIALPLAEARIYWLVGTFLIVPLAYAISRLLGIDPFFKDNPLANLSAYTHVSIIYFLLPIVAVAFLYLPDALLLTMAIAYCTSFFVFTWAFGSTLFFVHAVLRIVGVTLIWFALPDARTLAVPLFVAAMYLATALIIPSRRHAWLAAHPVATAMS